MPEEPVQSSESAEHPEAQEAAAEGALDDASSAAEVTDEALEGVSEAVSGLKSAAGMDDRETPSRMNLPSLQGQMVGGEGSASSDLKLLNDVNLHVKVELGRTRMYIEDVLKLNENSVIELDKLAGDPVDIYVNDQHVARGEVLVLNDNFCVRVSEVIQSVGDVT
jgi:flagellar motor switch protein FliN/FliY